MRLGDLESISTPISTLGINYYQGGIVTGSRSLSPELAERIGFNALATPPLSAPETTRRTSSPLPASRGFSPDTYLPRTAQQWQIDPIMLKHLLLRVHNDYTGPSGTSIYVTENGMAGNDVLTQTESGAAVHDPTREAFLELHLGAALDARDEGADVRGYFYWSFMDNYEWTWGYDMRFGIIYVDYETQRRIPKDSAKLYSRIIASRELNVAPDAGLLVRRGTLLENVPVI